MKDREKNQVFIINIVVKINKENPKGGMFLVVVGGKISGFKGVYR